MEGDGLLVLESVRCNAPDRYEEWGDWYDAELLPDLVATGVDVATRFQVVPPPVPMMPSIGFSHFTIYELRGADADARAEALLARGEQLRFEGGLHPNHCLMDLEVVEAHGRAGRKSDPDADLRGHIVAWVACNQPAREKEWDDWYDAQHLPDMLASEAFRAGSRWRRREDRGVRPRNLTLYDVAGMELEESVQKSAAVMPGLIAAGRKLDCHVGGMTFTVQACGAYGGKGLRREAAG